MRSPTFGDRVLVMGVVGVAPDSFWPGSRAATPAAAAERARELVAAGADLVDLGAVSSKPGAGFVSVEVETERLLPALRAVRAAVDVPLSVGTSRAAVAERALAEGADVINDVAGLADARLAALPGWRIAVDRTRLRPDADPIAAVRANLSAILQRAAAPERVVLDPGFGYGKTPEQNLQLVARLAELRELERPLCLSPSRKGTIGRVLGGLPVEERLEGTAALVSLAVDGGVGIVRVHDVRAMVRVVRVAEAVARARSGHAAAGTCTVRVAGLRLRGAHGVYEWERQRPQAFAVDLDLDVAASAAHGDQLPGTCDYGAAARVAAEVVAGPPCNLIETLAGEIAERLMTVFPALRAVRVRVHKPEAPLRLPFGDIHAEVRRER